MADVAGGVASGVARVNLSAGKLYEPLSIDGALAVRPADGLATAVFTAAVAGYDVLPYPTTVTLIPLGGDDSL